MSLRCCICSKKAPATLHSFPKDDVYQALWKQTCNYTEKDNVSRLKICSNHFQPKDYYKPNAKKLGCALRLRPNAVPSVSVPNKCIKNEPMTSVLTENTKLEVRELPEVFQPEMVMISVSTENIKSEVYEFVEVPSNTLQSTDSTMSIQKELFPPEFVFCISTENIKLEDEELPEETTIHSMESTMLIQEQSFLPELVTSTSLENIKLEVEELLEVSTIQSIDSTMLSQNQLFPAKTQLKTTTSSVDIELDETVPCAPKRNKIHYPSYVGKLTPSNMASLQRIKMHMTVAQANIKKKDTQIRALQAKVGKLQRKISSLQRLLASTLKEYSQDRLMV